MWNSTLNREHDMAKEILKWLAALAVGGLTAALTYIGSHAGTPGGIDPLIAGVIVAVLKRLVDFLVSKLPVPAPQ